MTVDRDENEILSPEELEERDKANKALSALIETLAEYHLRAQDLLVVYGNLGYAIGASMEGHKGNEGPGLEELQQAYYTSPSVGIALMLQGMLITSWHSDVASETNLEDGELE